ncbi:acetyl/propionyl/methylcrotonyl-CoA carboxylase subunit alpha [Marinicella sp. W31]|uniref:acetyl/propionyl/methylcrotonyl-CoA carboxylase subunit alpha n=1 Tax=Marinicella sp. W31 TaxID=3023713 RepID=UPI00375642D3
MSIKKILIANRGEIACRIIQTCRQLGITTVAVYSQADRYARHVAFADEAYYIGPSAPDQSYLNIEQLIAIAKESKVDAVHPGYGFLSERSAFAEAVAEAGLVFIGAPISALQLMGSKSAAKQSMEAAGVPCVPGYHGDNQDAEFLAEQATAIGFPVLIKAVAGGGGKGMKIVSNDSEFIDALNSAKREAIKAFGDDAVILEKYIEHPRHIEVQVFADTQGNVVHLFERDCSTQRRYQKIIEEAPASYLTDDTRVELLNTAVDATKAIDYVGAGTIEFILDEEDNFYFMEMNTRLQVEHRVTEMITRTDLVEWQIRVAEGQPLPKNQMSIQAHGHAIEVRIYAEDPDNKFLPATGVIQALQFTEAENIMIDSAVQQSDEVSIHYDPMIAKIVVWERDRKRCIRKLKEALNASYLFGLKTNMAFLSSIVSTDAFQSNAIYTNSLDKGDLDVEVPLEAAVAAIYVDSLYQQAPADSLWQQGDQWRLNALDRSVTVAFEYQGEQHQQTVVKVGDEYRINGTHYYRIHPKDNCHLFHKQAHVIHKGKRFELLLPDVESQSAAGANSNQLNAPMPGRIIDVKVKIGDAVNVGDSLLVMEAMKMELNLKAEKDTVVKLVEVCADQQVVADQLLVEFEES